MTLTAPVTGLVDTSYTLTATVEPPDTSLPLNYLWQVAGMEPLTHTGGLSDTLDLAWSQPGEQVITVTASNGGGEVSAWQAIWIDGPMQSLQIDGAEQGVIGEPYTFTAAVSPLNATQPMTYVWQVDGQELITSSGGLSDTAVFTWSEAGEKTITVSVENTVSVVTGYHPFVVSIPPIGVEVSSLGGGFVDMGSSFVALVSPITATQPLTYVWQVEGQLPITHTGGVSDTLDVAWDAEGRVTIISDRDEPGWNDQPDVAGGYFHPPLLADHCP